MLASSRHFAVEEGTMFAPDSVRVPQSVKAHVEPYSAELERQGYRPLSILQHLRLLAHLGRWLEARGLAVRDLTEDCAIAFVRHRARLGKTGLYSARGLEPLLGFLRSVGAAPAAAPTADQSPVGLFVDDFAAYLAQDRGLAAATIQVYTGHVRRFVQVVCPRLDWSRLTGAEMGRFLVRVSRRKGTPTCIQAASSLRSLLRYLHLLGAVPARLTSTPLRVARYRLTDIPKALDAAQIQRLLDSFDASPVGIRDTAIVLLLLRLGLRAREVAALDLDDISWRTGEFVVRGKGRCEDRLPLPRDIGQSISAYLRCGRPHAITRALFVRAHAPFTRLLSARISHCVGERLRQSGVRKGGAHVLRHTAATQLLRRGSSLPEIAHVLRHRHIDTTAIYAKVDLTGLAELARPWPGSAP
jgi:site-specific recombinase XerD